MQQAATMAQQHTPKQKALAVEMYNSGATSQEVEKRTGIKAAYVRSLAKRLSKKNGAGVAEDVSGVIASETARRETVEAAVKQGRGWIVWICSGFAHSEGWKVRLFTAGAFVLVMCHAGLIWYDMATLWAVPGRVGGAVVFAFIFIGMVLMSEKGARVSETRDNILWAVGFLEALAVVVHRGAFYHSATEAYQAGLGEMHTWALASVICLCSIGATIFYQKVIGK